MVSSILPLKVVHMWYKVWTWSQTQSHSGHFKVGIQNPSNLMSELKITIDQKWYTWEKNVVNTINGPYKKADLKKKKFRDFATFQGQNGQKLIFTLGHEIIFSPRFFSIFWHFYFKLAPTMNISKNFLRLLPYFWENSKSIEFLGVFQLSIVFRHENGPSEGATG